jgi:hypothetical protein
MSIRTCARQPEVKELLASGHWPHACPADLRAHLAGCRGCAELLLVTQAFQRSRTVTAAQVELPPPGVLWWRAQLRRRNAALERVGRPIVGAYVFALAITLLVAAVGFISQARHGVRWLDWLGQLQLSALHVESANASSWIGSAGGLLVLLPVFATLLLVGAVVVYLAAERR